MPPSGILGSRPCVTNTRHKRKKRYGKHCLKVYYTNANGLNSKLNSLNEIVDEINPSIICVNESKIKQYDKTIVVNGYCKPIELRRETKNGGGIWITYKEYLKNKITVLEIGNDEIEQIWLNIKTGPEDTILGVVYGKQESRADINNIKSFLEKIDYYAIKAKNEGKSLLVVGDFNMKVGETIKGNHEEISKGGKMLLKLINKRKLEIVNNSPKCSGLWTRIVTTDSENDERKSVLDYVLTNQKCYHKTEQMCIDEDRNFVMQRYSKDSVKESDHNAIIINLNLKTNNPFTSNPKSCKWILTKNSLLEFKKQTEDCQLKVGKNDKNIDSIYEKWEEEVNNVSEKCFRKYHKRKGAKQDVTKNEKELRGKKRQLKRKLTNYVNTGNLIKVEIYKIRIKLINKRILRIKNDLKKINLEKNIDQVKKVKVNSTEFYNLRTKLLGKKHEYPTSLINEEGIELTDVGEILKEHENYFKKLLTNREPEKQYRRHKI